MWCCKFKFKLEILEEFFFVNPPGSVGDLKNTTFLREFRRHVLWILEYFTKTIKENM